MGNKKILAKTEWPEVKIKFDKKEYGKGIQIEKFFRYYEYLKI